MADTKISALSAGTAPDGTETAAWVQGGSNVKLTAAQLATLANTINMGTAITASGALPSGDLGKLTPITTSGVAVTLPSAAALDDGTQAVLWNVSAGDVTVNSTTVQAGGIIVHYVRSAAWVLGNKPYAASAGGGGGLELYQRVGTWIGSGIGAEVTNATLHSSNALGMPIILGPGTYNAVGFRTGASAQTTGATVRAAVYDVGTNGAPSTVLGQSAETVKTDTTGTNITLTLTSSFVVTQTKVVMAALRSSHADTVVGHTLGHLNLAALLSGRSDMGTFMSGLILNHTASTATAFSDNPGISGDRDRMVSLQIYRSA